MKLRLKPKAGTPLKDHLAGTTAHRRLGRSPLAQGVADGGAADGEDGL